MPKQQVQMLHPPFTLRALTLGSELIDRRTMKASNVSA